MNTKRAVIYTRASLDKTGQGQSVARQEKACRALAEARGWEVVGVRSDNSISAYGDKERPAWEAVLGLVEEGAVDVVIAWHLDRMTRSMVDLERLIVLADKAGVGVATATGDIDLTTDVGRMVARILSAVARAEIERKGARQKLANAARAQRGVPWTGGPRRFGYTQDGLTLVEEEAEAIREAARAVLDGATLADVVRSWQAKGLTSGRSYNARGVWSTNGVKNVLTSPRYAGRSVYRGEDLGESVAPAVLDLETHLALVARLGDPSRRVGTIKRGAVATTLLTGVAECGVCGGVISASSVRGRPTYKCRAGGCVSVPRGLVDEWVAAWVIDAVSRPSELALWAPVDEGGSGGAREDAEDARGRLEGLAEAFGAGAITLSQMTTASKALRERLETAERVLAVAGAGEAVAPLLEAEDLAEVWEDIPLPLRRRAVGALVEVRLLPSGKSRKGDYDPAVKVLVNDKSPATRGE